MRVFLMISAFILGLSSTAMADICGHVVSVSSGEVSNYSVAVTIENGSTGGLYLSTLSSQNTTAILPIAIASLQNPALVICVNDDVGVAGIKFMVLKTR